jgi:hypothetical protein
LPGLQEVLSGIGSIQNIQVTRLMRAKSFYLVEGEDVKLLRALQSALDSRSSPIDIVPHAELGGRGGWSTGVPSQLPSTNAEGGRIRSYAILDRDYFPDQEVAERYSEARRWGIQLRVWSRKEIENYTLVPETIRRYIASRTRDNAAPDTATVEDEVDRIIQEMQEEILDAMATLLLARDKRGGLAKANKTARTTLTKRWETREGRWAVAPGKRVISRLAGWSQRKFGVGFGAEALAREMTADEVDPEVKEVLEAIAESRAIETPFAMPR